MSKSIFQLNDEARALDALIDQHLTQSGGEMTPEAETVITGWLEESGGDIDKKLDAYAAVIAEREALASARKAEAARYRALAQADENAVAGMKERLCWFFEARGFTTRETEAHKFTLAQNGGKVPLVIDEGTDPEDVPVVFTRRELDREMIRAALEHGECLEFARLGERGKSIRIR
jgi:hypothetical protein